MKKLLLFASIVLTLSCSSDDNSSSSNNSSSKITPPAWIQGTWVMEDVATYGYKFYTDDLCQIISSHENCMKEYINLYQGTNVVTNVSQQISDTEYKCSITVSAITNNFHFQKISPNVIKDVNMSNSAGRDVLFIKQ